MARFSRIGAWKDVLAQPPVLAGVALLGISLIALPLVMVAADKHAHRPRPSLSNTSVAPASKAPDATKAVPASAAAKTPTPTGADAHRTKVIAFYANFDDAGYPSLEANIDKIDVLMPMWYHLDSRGNITIDDAQKQARAMALVRDRRPDLKVMPIVNNYDKSSEKWNAPQVAKMLANPKTRKSIARGIVSVMQRDGFDGVNIDFESFTAADKANIVAFMADLYPLAQAAGLEVSMDVIVAGSAYDHAQLAQHVDYLIPMMYDEHWKTSHAGPISSHGWFERTLDGFYGKVPAEKVVIGLGTYTYDWGRSGARAKSKTYPDAMAIARQYDKPMNVSSAALNSTFSYSADGVKHQVWVLDAISMFNAMKTAYPDKPRGYAIWRLGAEDPAIWNVVPRRDTLDASVAGSLDTDTRDVFYDEASGLITKGQTRP